MVLLLPDCPAGCKIPLCTLLRPLRFERNVDLGMSYWVGLLTAQEEQVFCRAEHAIYSSVTAFRLHTLLMPLWKTWPSPSFHQFTSATDVTKLQCIGRVWSTWSVSNSTPLALYNPFLVVETPVQLDSADIPLFGNKLTETKDIASWEFIACLKDGNWQAYQTLWSCS